MTTQTEQALRLALDALIWTTGSADFSEGGTAREGALKLLFPAIAACKEALAAPQGEGKYSDIISDGGMGPRNSTIPAPLSDALAYKLETAPQGAPSWADMQREAQEIVEGKLLWKRFIDGTPLSNDIACWMADFAQEYTHPAPAPLTDEQIAEIVDRSWGSAWDAKAFVPLVREIERHVRGEKS